MLGSTSRRWKLWPEIFFGWWSSRWPASRRRAQAGDHHSTETSWIGREKSRTWSWRLDGANSSSDRWCESSCHVVVGYFGDHDHSTLSTVINNGWEVILSLASMCNLQGWRNCLKGLRGWSRGLHRCSCRRSQKPWLQRWLQIVSLGLLRSSSKWWRSTNQAASGSVRTPCKPLQQASPFASSGSRPYVDGRCSWQNNVKTSSGGSTGKLPPQCVSHGGTGRHQATTAATVKQLHQMLLAEVELALGSTRGVW